MEIQPIVIKPFGDLTKGMLTRTLGEKIVGGVPLFLRNTAPSKLGAHWSGLGNPKVTLTLNTGEYIDNMFVVNESGVGDTIYAITTTGRVFRINPSTWAVTQLTNIVPTPVTAVVSMNGWTIFVSPNGLRKVATNGTTIYNFVIPKPSTPSASAGGSGNLNGTYSWVVTFITRRSDGQGELEGEPSSAVSLSLTNQQANLTIPTSSDPQVVARAIYRYGGTVNSWRLVAVINDNTTTTFTDNTPDANIIAAKSLDLTTKNMPNAATAAAVYLGRLWLGNKDTVYFSEVENFVVYHDTTDAEWKGGWMNVDIGVGEIQFMATIGQGLLIYKSANVWLLAGTTPDNFVLSQIGQNIGIASYRHAYYTGSSVIWFRQSSNGHLRCYIFDGSNFSAIGDEIENVMTYLTRTFSGVDETLWSIAALGQRNLIAILIKRTSVSGDPGGTETTLTSPITIDQLRPLHFLLYDGSWSFAGHMGVTPIAIRHLGENFIVITHGGKVYEWQPYDQQNVTAIVVQSGWWDTPDGARYALRRIRYFGKFFYRTSIVIETEAGAWALGVPYYRSSMEYFFYDNVPVGRRFRFTLKVSDPSGTLVAPVLTDFEAILVPISHAKDW